MARQFLKDLKDGDSVDEIYLLADKQLRANRQANLFLLASLRDRTGQMSGLMWNVNEEQLADVSAGDYVRVRGKVQLFQGNLQMILVQIRSVPAEQQNPEDFEQRPSGDVEVLLRKLRELLLSIERPAIRSLMECFLIDEEFMNDLAKAAAGVKTHHAYRGGLVEHIVNMLETAKRIRDLYPAVDFDVLMAGIFLHDLGKVREMSLDNAYVYTDEGQLLGHLIIGIEMLSQKIVEVEKLTKEPFPTELALRLKHMIASHHGSYEHGAVRLPMTPEAIALHHLDNLDAKVHEFARSIADDPNTGSNWTPFFQRIDRKLFKGQLAPS
jgi:3'-5' exoribonuclease